MKTKEIYTIYNIWQTIPRADYKEALRELMYRGVYKASFPDDKHMTYDGKTFAIVAEDGTIIEESQNPYDVLDKYIGYKKNIRPMRPDMTFYRFLGKNDSEDVDRPISDFQNDQEAIEEAIISERTLYKVTASYKGNTLELLYMDKERGLYYYHLMSEDEYFPLWEQRQDKIRELRSRKFRDTHKETHK